VQAVFELVVIGLTVFRSIVFISVVIGLTVFRSIVFESVVIGSMGKGDRGVQAVRTSPRIHFCGKEGW